MRIILPCILAIAFLVPNHALSEPVQVLLAGDSTMAEKLPENRPEAGWGEMLQEWFPIEDVVVINHARNGRSTRSFIEEGRWDALLAQVTQGDHVLIQFAHNDQFPKKKPKRYASPEMFKANLARFVADVQALDATPVLLTPVVRRRFDDRGVFYDTHGVYPNLVREAAAQTSTALIDLHASSMALLQDYGEERSKDLFLWLEPGESANYPGGVQDNTHFSTQGARAIASLAARDILVQLPGLAEHMPVRISHNLLDHSNAETLGLEAIPGAETITLFKPGENAGAFNHGVVLMPFKGSLFAQWQSSHRDEDAPDTRVLYSVSPDGKQWSAPRALISDPGYGAHSNGGWWQDGDTLVAFVVRWQSADESVRSGVTEYIATTDGANWSHPAPVRDHAGKAIEGVIEQDPHVLPNGRIITAFHMQPGLVLTPFYTDEPLAVTGWTRGKMQNLPFVGDTSRELEPSWFLRADGAIVMIMRDQASSFRKLVSVSMDRGETWSGPVVTSIPDSRSKQSAGNLPDGTAYIVSNPTLSKQRFPLVLMLSRDGRVFDRARLLRAGGADLQPRRFEGRYKRVGFSYPKSVIWGDYLYVAYATNKEDVELTRVPLSKLAYRSHGAPGEVIDDATGTLTKRD